MLQHLKFILPAICQNESRKNIMWAKCEIKGDYLYMLATNGHIVKTVKTGICREITTVKNGKTKTKKIKGGVFYMDLNAVKKAVRVANKSDFVQIHKDKITVLSESSIDIKYKPYGLDYPNLDPILKANIPVEIKSMGVQILSMISVLKESVGTKNVKIDFVTTNKKSIGAPKRLFRIDFLNNEHMAYLMPAE